jgi:hypothetical protein
MPDQFKILATAGFDLNIAVFLAQASQAAYDDASSTAWAKGNGFTNVKTFNRGNIQGFWCAGGDVALLSFRGTSNPGQWLRDAHFLPVAHPWGRVHQGFRDGVAQVETDLREFDPVARNAQHFWITGHSLGGALALIAAARFKMQPQPLVPNLYTYGQPRVGLVEFADRFGIELPGRLVRFVNQSDIVTRVPPGFLFQHTGIVKRIVRPGVLEAVVESMVSPAVPTAKHVIVESVGPESASRATGTVVLESARAVEKSEITEATLIEADIPPLTEQQFAELQMALGSAAPAPELEGIGIQMEGFLPWISDHAISEYIRLLTDVRDKH